jgi:hypothetical protein
MANDDWFRRKTWTEEDRAEFAARLRRSRGAIYKAQYSRIQAYTLQTVGTEEALLAALELLDTILAEWRSEAELAAVHHQYAECLVLLGHPDRAVDSFREVFATQRLNRGHITGAHLNFGWLAITTPMPSLYAEVLGVLDEFRSGVFVSEVYRDAAIRAIIHHSRGEDRPARDFAKLALNAAAVTQSQLPRHPGIGLVTSPDPDIHAQLQAILAGP